MTTMDTALSQDLAMSFRDAIRNALMQEDPIIREGLLNSLELSTEGNEKLNAIFRSETAPAQATAIVHIVEAKTREHSANALSVSKFLGKLVSAVNEVAKQKLGAERRAPQLLITGTAPGSLEITIQAPDDVRAGDLHSHYAENDIEIPETAESAALKTVGALLTAASSEELDDRESPISAQLAQLTIKARKNISSMTKEVRKTDWTIHGEILQRRQQPLRIQFTQLGALRLEHELGSVPEKPDKEIIRGYLDGYRRSEGILYVKRSLADTRALPISVSDPDLIQQVAEYSIQSERLYRLDILKYEKLNTLGDIATTSRSLQAIDIDLGNGIQGTVDFALHGSENT
ncbi:hypothetical protein [Bifidobacterium mongoliense]|uniref:Uncharacterized protein n=1 Tax=Bifidobacterium mongoliense DSM 21395 TaxID=1437603 RepID=A0A087BZS3_9BIFI|nr:hypothetical protein [Bifidobacterium mongoliense]KFI76523.1 hypothetical protein BMON_1120 [Bifidobacterium mongoliense DSM 21395]